PANHARNPFAVEVFARDDDDAAIAEVERGGEDAAVPEREDRLPPLVSQQAQHLAAALVPRVRAAQGLDDRHADRGHGGPLESLARRKRHMPSNCGPSPPSGGTQSMIW